MFNQLIESKPQKQKMAGGTVFSFVFHSALIATAIIVTKNAGIADDKTKQEKIQFVEMKKEPPKPKEAPPPPPPKEVMRPRRQRDFRCFARQSRSRSRFLKSISARKSLTRPTSAEKA